MEANESSEERVEVSTELDPVETFGTHVGMMLLLGKMVQERMAADESISASEMLVILTMITEALGDACSYLLSWAQSLSEIAKEAH